MQKFMYKQQGAISIFLAIILIPMMCIASVYIDASRIRLAKSVASSAGDLTLNTALTNYDNILKDMYGLFAVSQTEDELMDNLEDYYRKSLTSAGLTAEDANTYVGKIMAQLGMVADGSDVSDLLRIELDEGQDIIKKNETASLANPYMLKKQIVEFMKYRFGVGVGMSFISSLKSFDTLAEQMTVIDNRTTYYEEQTTVIEACEIAWKNIVKYNELNTNVTYFDNLKTELEKAKDNYKYITNNYLMDFYNSKSRDSANKNYYAEESTIVIKKTSDTPEEYKLYVNGTEHTDFGTYTNTTPATDEKLSQLSTDLCTHSDNFKTLKNSDKYSIIFMTGNDAGVYENQRVIQFNRLAEEDDNISDTMKDYYITYHSLAKAIQSVKDSITYYEGEITKLEGEIDDLEDDIAANESKISISQGLVNVSQTAIDANNVIISGHEYEIDVLIAAQTIANMIDTATQIAAIQEKIDALEDDNSELQAEIDTQNADIARWEEENEGYQEEIDEKQETIEEYQQKVTDLNALLTKQVTYYGTTKTYEGILEAKKANYNADCNLYAEVVKRMLDIINLKDVTKEFINGTSIRQDNTEWVAGTKSNEEIKRIAEKIGEYHDTLKSASEFLGTASSKLGEVITSLETGGNLYKARETWEKSAEVDKISGTVVSQQNADEVKTVEEFMDAEEVKELKTRVDGTKSTIDTILAEVESYYYAEGNLYDIVDIDTLITTIDACSVSFDFVDVPLKYADLKTKSNEIYTAYMKYPSHIMSKPWEGQSSTDWINSVHPVMETAGGECAFYNYLKKNFPNITEDGAAQVNTTNKKKGEIGESEEKLKSAGDSAKNESVPDGSAKGPEFGTSGNTLSENSPSKYWESTLKAAVQEQNANAGNSEEGIGTLDAESPDFISQLSSLFSKIGDMLASFAVDFRDNIYIADYVLSMFSYDTYEKEKMYNILKEKGDVDGEAGDLSDLLKQATTGSLYNDSNSDGVYEFIGTKYPEDYQKAARTLTNIPISPNNNKAYLSEVEYIIYGANGTGDTYATIFGIRFAFNTIYAFTDSEIREGALSLATSVFGCPPLTFLVPIAQVAIIIAIALGESGIDLGMLKAGMEVPLFKTNSTWVLKFSSLMKTLASEAADAAIDYVADKATATAKELVDSGVATLNSWLDKTDAEVDEWLDAQAGELQTLTGTVEEGINETITRYSDAAINQLVSICQVAESLKDSSGKIDGQTEVEYIKAKLTTWLNDESAGLDAQTLANDIGYMAKEAAISIILSNDTYINDILAAIRMAQDNATETVVAITEKMQEKIQLVRTNINLAIDSTNQKIKDYKTQAVQKISDAIDDGGAKFKDAISEAINGKTADLKEAIGGMDTSGAEKLTINKDGNTAATFLAFSYSDYLRLFLVIGLTFNQEDILLRTADVIEANVKLKDDDKTTFLMKEAYTYVNIEADLKVKPLMLTLPFMKDLTDTNLSGEDWYTVEYKGILGY